MVVNSWNRSKLQSGKTRAPFGRTELSTGANGTTVCALSLGHGFRGPGSHGVFKNLDCHVFLFDRF